MTSTVLVTGGTGTIGSRVVPLLTQEGCEVRVLSRHPRADEPHVRHYGGDTVTGRGLEPALDGVETVLHLAGGAKGDDVAARTLGRAARRAGVRHLMLISVVGADRMPIGYFRSKASAEREFAGSGVPWTVLRVAQLHDFVLPMVRGMARLPLLPTPVGLRFEPVDVDEVAARLAELTRAQPAGRVADLAGPDVLDIRALVGTFAESLGRRPRRGLRFGIPGAVGAAYRSGANLADESAQRGTRTWAEFVTGAGPRGRRSTSVGVMRDV